jgi:hypothetical protein
MPLAGQIKATRETRFRFRFSACRQLPSGFASDLGILSVRGERPLRYQQQTPGPAYSITL